MAAKLLRSQKPWISLDYLVGISSEIVKDKKMINSLEDIKKLPEKNVNKYSITAT